MTEEERIRRNFNSRCNYYRKMATDPEFRKKRIEASIDYLRRMRESDPEFEENRRRKNREYRERIKNDPKYILRIKESRKLRTIRYRTDPVYREKVREISRNRGRELAEIGIKPFLTQEQKERRNALQRWKYKNDPVYREKCLWAVRRSKSSHRSSDKYRWARLCCRMRKRSKIDVSTKDRASAAGVESFTAIASREIGATVKNFKEKFNAAEHK